MPRVAEVRPIARGEGEAIVYFRFDLPWPIADRDYTVRYRWHRAGEALVVELEDANGSGPPRGDPVRVERLRGRFSLAPVEGGTLVDYVFTADFGGRMTRGMKEQAVWKQPLQSVLGIRRAVEPAR
jgi:hypothetical protein